MYFIVTSAEGTSFDRSTNMDKSLGTLCISGRFTIQTGITPPPHPKNNVGRLYLEFFPSFNILWVGRENFEKDALFHEGTKNDRKL